MEKNTPPRYTEIKGSKIEWLTLVGEDTKKLEDRVKKFLKNYSISSTHGIVAKNDPPYIHIFPENGKDSQILEIEERSSSPQGTCLRANDMRVRIEIGGVIYHISYERPKPKQAPAFL